MYMFNEDGSINVVAVRAVAIKNYSQRDAINVRTNWKDAVVALNAQLSHYIGDLTVESLFGRFNELCGNEVTGEQWVVNAYIHSINSANTEYNKIEDVPEDELNTVLHLIWKAIPSRFVALDVRKKRFYLAYDPYDGVSPQPNPYDPDAPLPPPLEPILTDAPKVAFFGRLWKRLTGKN